MCGDNGDVGDNGHSPKALAIIAFAVTFIDYTASGHREFFILLC